MADTLDTPQTKKMQRERGREARKERWEEKDTRFHTREPYVKPSAQQWQDYAEQEAAYRKMAQDAAKAALAPTESETPAKKAAPGGGGGGSRGAKKQPQQKQAYAGEVDTELPVGVIAPDETAPYEEPEAPLPTASAITEAIPNSRTARRIAEIYSGWASDTSVVPLTKEQRLGLPGANEYLDTGVPYYGLARDADPRETEKAWHATKLLLRKLEEDYDLGPGGALARLPKEQRLAVENIRYAAELARARRTQAGARGVDYGEREGRDKRWLESYVSQGRTPAERERLRQEGEEILRDAKRQEAME
jgi:hypothetical protein